MGSDGEEREKGFLRNLEVINYKLHLCMVTFTYTYTDTGIVANKSYKAHSGSLKSFLIRRSLSEPHTICYNHCTYSSMHVAICLIHTCSLLLPKIPA